MSAINIKIMLYIAAIERTGYMDLVYSLFLSVY